MYGFMFPVNRADKSFVSLSMFVAALDAVTRYSSHLSPSSSFVGNFYMHACRRCSRAHSAPQLSAIDINFLTRAKVTLNFAFYHHQRRRKV
jgi:hypothetical protein